MYNSYSLWCHVYLWNKKIDFPLTHETSLFDNQCCICMLIATQVLLLLSIQQMYSNKVWQTVYNKCFFFSSFMSIWQPPWKLSQPGPFTKLVQIPDTDIGIPVKVMLFSLTQTSFSLWAWTVLITFYLNIIISMLSPPVPTTGLPKAVHVLSCLW